MAVAGQADWGKDKAKGLHYINVSDGRRSFWLITIFYQFGARAITLVTKWPKGQRFV